MRIDFSRPHLGVPALPWPGPGHVRYLMGTVMQVSPTQAALMCNLHWYGAPVSDLEAGVDAVVFDRLDAIDPARALPLVRNHEEKHPRTGQPLVMVKCPIWGGFVPLGAKLDDGRPHPFAGTGFGHSTAVGFPADHSLAWPGGEKDLHMIQEIQQYRFDGQTLHVVASARRPLTWPFPDMELHNGPLTNAIPDGPDLLFAMTLRRPGATPGLGLTRWRCTNAGWAPVEVVPVSGEDGTCEPSLVRDRDGALIMAGRGAWGASVQRGHLTADRIKPGSLLAWRSADGGRTWQSLLDIPKAIQPCPVTINRTVAGRLFFASNPPRESRVAPNGKTYHPGGLRTPLSLWPLDADGPRIGPEIVALDCDERFGRTATGSPWLADHPNASVIRLADGRLHCLLCVRVASLEETDTGESATPESGCWIGEVIDDPGTLDATHELPLWRF